MSAPNPEDDSGSALSDSQPCRDEQHSKSQTTYLDYGMARSKSATDIEGSIHFDQRASASPFPVHGFINSAERTRARPERSKSVGARQRHQAKIAQEERHELLDGWYDCEVVRRGKAHAWVKPLNESDIPEDVRLKLQDMNFDFQQKCEAQGKRFCGGILENVIYVSTLDLADKGVALIVGMKVRLKLYTDNKGVGGYEVIPSREHIEKVRDAIQKNFKTERGLEKTKHLTSILRGKNGDLKNVLFVGECTHAFSVAAGRLCGVVPHEGDAATGNSLGENAAWCSTELIWPKGHERSDLEKLLNGNLNLLRSSGIWCADQIDAHALKDTLEARCSPCLSFDTIFWMMPYVAENRDRSRDRFSGMMQNYILSFVSSAAEILNAKGSIAVVVTSAQCLSWRLCQDVLAQNGMVLIPEVWWFDVSRVEQLGYQSRFGDGRDGYIDCPGFHMLSDLVIVCWRERAALDDGSGCDPRVGCVSDSEIMERKRMLERLGHESMENGFEFEHQHTRNYARKNVSMVTRELCKDNPASTALQFEYVPDVGDLVQVPVPHQDPPPGFKIDNFLLPLVAGDAVRIIHKEQEGNTVWLWAQKENCEDGPGWVLLEWLRSERSKPHEVADSGTSHSDAALDACGKMEVGSAGVKIFHRKEGDTVWIWAQRSDCKANEGWILLEWVHTGSKDAVPSDAAEITHPADLGRRPPRLTPDIGESTCKSALCENPPQGLPPVAVSVSAGDRKTIVRKDHTDDTVRIWAQRPDSKERQQWIVLE